MIRIACLAIGYCFGLFQTAYILGRMSGIDIREHGSGNSGTTNMLRTKGLGAGLKTLFGDIIKCVLAVLVVKMIFGESHADEIQLLCVYTATGVILGHDFPFYLGFKGGKGIAATAGFIISLSSIILKNPMHIITGIIVFFGIFLTTHYVSLGSLVVYIALVIETIIMGQMGYFNLSQDKLYEMYVLVTALAVLAFYLHRENIKRLLSGTERKTYLKKKSDK